MSNFDRLCDSVLSNSGVPDPLPELNQTPTAEDETMSQQNRQNLGYEMPSTAVEV